ncbi:ATP-binding cassette domain-containing protein [Piscinibacter koreensis]|uniref:ATP-binding cassette domain-containing protein n=1 Tax=Piscinibacter koreensis TaxID=2742824 RepID=A0A7Y6NL69_9BURK|nr:ATP-binding cassette domain-containing protein [Schlegelella koreensis]NUZ05236.1 ATP-binding cassette domain-containing protein [Schlegelella koreensis]
MKASPADRAPADRNKRGALPMITAFVRAYPGRSVAALFAVLLAGLMDGLGMSMLLSMLTLATREGAPSAEPSLPERVAAQVAQTLGMEPNAGVLLGLALALITLKGALSLLANRQVGYTVAHIATDLRLALIRAVMGARWRHHLRQSVGGLSNAVATEAQRASDAFQHCADMTAMLLNALIYMGIALSISWQAGLAAALAGAVLLTLLQSLIRSSRRAGQNQTKLMKGLLTSISGQLAAAKALKAMAREGHVDALLSDQTKKLRRAIRRQVVSREALSALQEPLLAMMVAAGFFLSLVVLKMPMAAVMVMLFMLARVVSYLSKAQRAYQQVAVRESAYWSLVDSIDAAVAQREPRGGERTVPLADSIRFEAVSFAHEEGQTILADASFTIPAQQLTVFVGPSGAGKTTVLDLVVGLLQPTAGRIVVDDVPLGELDLRQWRRQIGYVPQESILVNESIAYNVALGEEGIGEDDIRAALAAADALDFVDAMPEGIETPVGEGGSRLSGGQRQRLAIARALVHRPSLLILDEATSSLDRDAQAAVIETVRHLKGSLTILAVAHQDLLVQAADRVYRLAGGQVSTPVRRDPVTEQPVHG